MLRDAHPNKYQCNSKVRINKLWHGHVFGEKIKKILSFLVTDEQGDEMKVFVNDPNLDKWAKQLQKGSIYILQNVGFLSGQRKYIIVKANYYMTIEVTSIAIDASIPTTKYYTTPLDMLHTIDSKVGHVIGTR